jgi:4a-hydroxytetrahydrobiopterin dehydratase
MNLLGTPGLGSLMGGRWLEGLLQLALSLTGFVLFCVWFYKLVIVQFYGQLNGDVKPEPVGYIGLTGAALFAAAWFWSLITSISLMGQARKADVPPAITAYVRAVKLDESQILAGLGRLPQWSRNDQVISRTYEFADFLEAMKFVNAVAGIAEATQHHPDIDIRWNKVTLALTTHDAGGLTEKDFALAQRCDELAAPLRKA